MVFSQNPADYHQARIRKIYKDFLRKRDLKDKISCEN